MVVDAPTVGYVLVATAVLALAATATVGAIRLTVGHPHGVLAILALGGGTAVMAGLLWLDGRVHRYVGKPFWIAVVLAPAVGAVGGTSTRRRTTTATAAWIGAFALALAARLVQSADVGSAAAVGLLIEALVAAAFGFSGALSGAAVVAAARKHLSYAA